MTSRLARMIRLLGVLVCAGPLTLGLLPLGRTIASGEPDVVVTIDRRQSTGQARLQLGVTHTRYSADRWNDPVAVESAHELLKASAVFQNQHLMGWGTLNPNPAPGIYDWGSLDERIGLMRATGGVPVITLAGAPDWMKGGRPGQTDWSRLEIAPFPEHYAAFAELARRTAQRYPDVKHFLVWNELKGFWNERENRWDYEGYTAFYNQVYDALKSVDSTIQIGGPYVPLATGVATSMSHPASDARLRDRTYGTVDQRGLDVIGYWLAHAHGADFLAVDSRADDERPISAAARAEQYSDLTRWLAETTTIPIWWAEWYMTSWGVEEIGHAEQNARLAAALIEMVGAGASVALRWQPQGEAERHYEGNHESLWSDTRRPGGGQPFPFYFTTRAIASHFPPGTPLLNTHSSSASVRVLASEQTTILINLTPSPVRIELEGRLIELDGHAVQITPA